MAVNFFEARCMTTTSEKLFGIYDIPPASLDFTNSDVWIAWVDNTKEIEVTFTAIDKCLRISDSEGERCEGMMTHSDALIFIELKDAGSGRWAGKARDQLTNTISLFKRDVGLAGYARLYGYIVNKQTPHFKSGGSSFSQKFQDDTGFVLRVSDVIKIE
jgi:hypothetical protein